MKKGLTAFLLLLPVAVSAQTLQPLANLISAIAVLVGALIPILITAALAVFFWGLIRYLWPSGGKANTEGAKKLMIWGLLTLFVMVSVWGIVRIAQSALGIDPNASPTSPRALYPGAPSGGSNTQQQQQQQPPGTFYDI